MQTNTQMLQSEKLTAKIIIFNTKANFVHSELYFRSYSNKIFTSTSCCDYAARTEMGKGAGALHCQLDYEAPVENAWRIAPSFQKTQETKTSHNRGISAEQ